MLTKKIKFTDNHLKLMRVNFDLLDEDKDGKLDKNQAKTLYRVLGQTITEGALNEIIDKTLTQLQGIKEAPGAVQPALPTPGDLEGDKITFRVFVDMFAENYQQPISEDVLIEAFKLFDEKHTGTLTVHTLTDLLLKRGEALEKKSVDKFITLANIQVNGRDFCYVELAKKLLAGPSGVQTI